MAAISDNNKKLCAIFGITKQTRRRFRVYVASVDAKNADEAVNKLLDILDIMIPPIEA